MNPFCIADEQIIYHSPTNDVYAYTPAIVSGKNDRLIASFDLSGPDLKKELPPPYTSVGDCMGNQFHVMISDDYGKTWKLTARFAMLHAMLFRIDDTLYALGHRGELCITKSTDNGETWTEPVVLENKHQWHQSACNAEIIGNTIFAAYEVRLPLPPDHQWAWPNVLPVILSCNANTDLLNPENWNFGEIMDSGMILSMVNPNCGAKHSFPYVLESNLIRIRQTDHEFFRNNDPNLLLLMRTTYDFGATGAALRVVQKSNGKYGLDYIYREDGSKFFFFPMPGGNMKFFVHYDDISGYYWMTATQSVDAFLKSSPEKNSGGPRQRLCLYFSKDSLCWCFAGLIAKGEKERESRHYASFAITGEDLFVLSRSGNADAASQHNGNMITLHRVRNFRSLIY